jgi:hypothetical protein
MRDKDQIMLENIYDEYAEKKFNERREKLKVNERKIISELYDIVETAFLDDHVSENIFNDLIKMGEVFKNKYPNGSRSWGGSRNNEARERLKKFFSPPDFNK